MKAAIYVRVSTSEQAGEDKSSLGHQQERCEAYAKAHGWEVAAVYEDAGVSGTKEHRPALDQLLADAHDGAFQVVIFPKVDRFARNVRNLVNLEHDLGELGISIASVEDGFDTSTPSGRLHFNVLGSIAEFEREQIIVRTTAGREAAAKNGTYMSGRPPYGYDHDLETKKLAANEFEAKVVREAFTTYVREGLSYAALAKRLNDKGIPTKTSYVNTRSIDGKKKGWLPVTVARMLRNPAYYGEYTWNKTGKENVIIQPCPPIVSRQLWNKARQQAKRNKKRSELCPSGKDAVSPNLLSGLTRCHCGRKMHSSANYRDAARGGKVWRYLLCQGQGLYKTPCHEKRVNAIKVEHAVVEAIVTAYRDPDYVMASIDAHAEQLQRSKEAQSGLIAKKQAQLEEARARRDRAQNEYTDGYMNQDAFRRQMGRIDKDVAAWEDELARLEAAARQRKAAKEVEQRAWAIAGQIDGLVADMPTPEKKELIRALVEQVTVHAGGHIEIECAIPGLLDTGKVDTNHSPCDTTSGPRAAR